MLCFGFLFPLGGRIDRVYPTIKKSKGQNRDCEKEEK